MLGIIGGAILVLKAKLLRGNNKLNDPGGVSSFHHERDTN
jgi:hypothetical protein